MKRRRPLRIVLIVLASLFALYLIPSLYIGCRINQIILQSYHSYGENNSSPETISDTHYSYLNCHLPEETARAKAKAFIIPSH